MTRVLANLLCFALLSTQIFLPALSKTSSAKSAGSEPLANTLAIPKQILKTGVSLTAPGISPNSLQLANNIGLTPVLERIQVLRSQQPAADSPPTLETLAARQDLWEAIQQGALIIQRTNLDIDFTLAELDSELQVYNELMANFTSKRDKFLAEINAASFISNGVLWAAAEAFDIPTYKYGRWSIPSGTVGITAGIVPSLASMYTLKAVSGRKRNSEVEPNMMAKIFGYPTTPEIEYPHSVWMYLNQAPADNPQSKKRLDQMIDRWIADANMPAFTDRTARKQLDVITASVFQHNGLSITALSTRQVMYQQLSAEIMKMKRMLLELTMAVQGEKQLTATGNQDSLPRIGIIDVP